MPDQKVYYLANNDFPFNAKCYITAFMARQRILKIYIFFTEKSGKAGKNTRKALLFLIFFTDGKLCQIVNFTV